MRVGVRVMGHWSIYSDTRTMIGGIGQSTQKLEVVNCLFYVSPSANSNSCLTE